MEFSRADVDAAVANVDPSQGREHAKRMLSKWATEDPQIKNDDTAITLYLGLARLKKNLDPNARVSKEMMKQWKSEEQAGTKWKNEFYVVRRESKPDLGTTHAEWIVDPSTVSDWPANVKPAEVWLVDRGCPRSSLGPGVWIVEMFHTALYRGKGSPAAICAPILQEQVEAPKPMATTMPPAAAPVPRVLKSCGSDPPIPEDVAGRRNGRDDEAGA